MEDDGDLRYLMHHAYRVGFNTSRLIKFREQGYTGFKISIHRS